MTKKSISFAMLSDVGLIRNGNEDAVLGDSGLGLFVVADGMGGRQGGELASQMACEELARLIRAQQKALDDPATPQLAVSELLAGAIQQVSQAIYQASLGAQGLYGMGTTMVCLLIRQGLAHVAHVGDSRAYLFRDGELVQLTDDHSVVAVLLQNGIISAEEALTHPARSQITQFVGMLNSPHPDVCSEPLEPGDRLLLCSDVLNGMVLDDAIAAILEKHSDPEAACQCLVEMANAAGGWDNTSVIVLDYNGSPGRAK